MSEILWLGIKRALDGRHYVITEEEVECYRILGEYTSLAEAKRDLPFIRKNPRYAHLDKDGFAPEAKPMNETGRVMFASELRMEKRPSSTGRLLVRVRETGDSAGSITKVGTRWHAVDAFMEQAEDFKTRADALAWLAKVYRP